MAAQEAEQAREVRELRADAALLTVMGAASLGFALWDIGSSLLRDVNRTPGSVAIFWSLIAFVVATGIVIALDVRRLGFGSWLWATAAMFTWPIGPVIYVVVRLHGRRRARG